MSKFDKYFSNIQNKESRLYRRLQDLDDLIYDKYFNAFAGKTSYIAEVLSNTNESESTGPGGNSTLFMAIRVRIDGIHTNQIPDPYKAVQNLKGDEAVTKFNTLILSHPLAFPDTEIYSDSAVSQPLNRGDRIEVFFAEQGPQQYGRQRGLRYRKVIEPALARTVPEGFTDTAGTFDQRDTTSIGDIEAQYFNKSAAIAFIDRLAATSYFQGYSIPALAGVAANANAESNFVFDAAGDPRVDGAEKRAIETKNGISGKTGRYCSFGFFQLNVCGDGAEGMLIAQSKGWMTVDGKESAWIGNGKEQFVDWIKDLNGINQLSYVGPRLKSEGLPIGTDSAFEFGNLMTTRFEKPINAELKGRERGATAEKILEAYNKSKEGQQ
jgi:hypothetical protein